MKIRNGVPLVALGILGCSISDGSIGPSRATDESGGVDFGGPSFESPGVPLPGLPIDTRPVQTALTSPPPISGGTLLITQDGAVAVAADPDRDRVSIVSLTDRKLLHTVDLLPGDEPGRVVEDGGHRVHVALRRGGAVVTIDVASGKVLARRPVCGAPRGIAYEATADRVYVACAGGDLVTLPAAMGDTVWRVNLGADLRDVIARPDGLLVSRFKSGELLRVDTSGGVVDHIQLHGLQRTSDSLGQPRPTGEPIEPAVAWRTTATPDGLIFVLHQYALASTIKLKDPKGSPGSSDVGSLPGTAEPYGAPLGGCGGLVQPAISRLDASFGLHMGAPISAPVLAVDASVSPDGKWLLIAHAGTHDPSAPVAGDKGLAPSVVGEPEGVVTLVPASGATPGQVTAVAFNPSGTAAEANGAGFAAQTREPAGVLVFRDPSSAPAVIALGGDSVTDTGHDLFHRDTGAGIACASCHAEGGEDGRVWRFDPIGERRTQALHVGLEGTEPFHWDGDMTDFGTLVDEVMVRRMGGPAETVDRKEALQRWLFSLKPPAAIVDPEDARAASGRVLFESADVGCSGCHSGSKLTSKQSVYVGTTEPGHLLQVPSLHGIGYRAPFLHNGCAATLRDRFDPACGGGDQHGRTSQLGEEQIGDLIQYLGTL